MTAESLHRFRKIERVTLGVAMVAGVAAAILGWVAPHSLVPAWRLALFACLQPALGSLIFILIHRLTGGQWAHGLAPFLLSGARLLPWIWMLILPLLWFPIAARPPEQNTGARHAAEHHPPARTDRNPDLAIEQPSVARKQPGGRPSSQTEDAVTATEQVFASGTRQMGGPLRWYFSRPMLTARAALYAVVFLLLAMAAPRAMRATTTLRWFGPLGLLGLVFMLHLLTTDWIVMLDPGWYSTGFPLVWIAAQAIAGLAAAIAAAVVFGAEPSRRGHAEHVRGFDWGNLLLAAIMVWAYVAFVQWLIIWSGNLPAETAWYRHRGTGVWRWFSIAVAVVEFGAPFFLLLSRAVKKRRRGLGFVALLLLCGQLGYTTWLIAPAFPQATAHAPWLLLTFVIGALALFANRYLAGARVAAALLSAP